MIRKDTSEAATRPSICLVKGSGPVETFIRAHVDGLPARVTLVHGFPPSINHQPILPQSLIHRAGRKAGRLLRGREWRWETTAAYLKAFRRSGAQAVLAEFGQTGVAVLEACRRRKLPLIVHFHGADISKHAVLEKYTADYQEVFVEAKAIIAVSRVMKEKLISLGAPTEKVHYNPCGVDCDAFSNDRSAAAAARPVLLAVGRFVEKKAPQLTLLAFARVHHAHPEAKLRMIGDGPLFDACQDLARGLGLQRSVTFLGAQPPAIISEEMRLARAFVQHSIEAPSGDCEGTPVAVLEAGASGLPVVATRHAGIPDVVIEGETGLLVDERDVEGMAVHLLRLLREPLFAARLGDTARSHIRANFSMRQSLDRLWAVIEPVLAPDRLSGRTSRFQPRPVRKSAALSSCHSEGQK